MDINYTGCLAVSLYGILIQGCRHNGNPHHGLRCSPARWREEKKEETWTPGVKGEAKELAGRRPLCLLLLVRSCVYSAASFALSFPCFPSWRSICITLHLSPLLLSLSLSLSLFLCWIWIIASKRVLRMWKYVTSEARSKSYAVAGWKRFRFLRWCL